MTDYLLNNTLINNFIIGVISGIISSLLFYVIIRFRAPKLKASKKVLIRNGIIYIKLMNMLWYKAAIDVHVQLNHVIREYIEDGHIANHSEIKLAKNHLFQMNPRRICTSEGAWIFRSEDQFYSELSDTSYIRFRIMATEPTFGIKRVFTFDYKRGDLLVGDYKFKSGRSWEIIKGD